MMKISLAGAVNKLSVPSKVPGGGAALTKLRGVLGQVEKPSTVPTQPAVTPVAAVKPVQPPAAATSAAGLTTPAQAAQSVGKQPSRLKRVGQWFGRRGFGGKDMTSMLMLNTVNSLAQNVNEAQQHFRGQSGFGS